MREHKLSIKPSTVQGDADAEVVHASGVTQAHFAVGGDVVVAEPVVPFAWC